MGILSRIGGAFRRTAPKGVSAAPNNPTTVLGRVRSIARANINDMLSEASNPEKLADELILQYGGALEEARNAVQEVISTLRVTEGRQAEDEAEIATWRDRAELAAARSTKLQSKDPQGAAKAEAMALTALKKERALEIRVEERRSTIEDQLEIVEGLKRGIEQMQDRYEVLKDRRDTLVSRARFAEAQGTVAKAVRAADSEDSSSKLSGLERSVREREAMAQGQIELTNSSIEAQFRALENDSVDTAAERDLAVLMGRSTRSLTKRGKQ